jgi:hypothetical protein
MGCGSRPDVQVDQPGTPQCSEHRVTSQVGGAPVATLARVEWIQTKARLLQ